MEFAGEFDTTSKNLLAAYQNELNAQASYKAFASKADEEGFGGLGSLFRATARAEQIHSNNQARALRQSGGEARADVVPMPVGATLDNLKAALKGETYEIEVMYPKFAEQASAHIHAQATRTFTQAMEAEKTHAELFANAIAQIESRQAASWVSTARDFHVCPMCAFTSEQKVDSNCPVCGYPAERFEVVA
ncbi:MAG TPA: ferritin family protein [Terracidiphilus sp.]|nr:ferritin family protein [Terracidiphilus sp.]